MALVVNDRVKETSTTSGTGTLNLAGAVTGFVTFVAGIGDTNTTYYAIFEQGTANWETGVGTVTDAATDTLARTTVLSNSLGSTAKISFGGTLDVFCTLPASQVVFGKQQGTDFTGSLLVGHTTTGTLNAAQYNTGVGLAALDAITSGDSNTAVGNGAMGAQTTGSQNVAVGSSAMLVSASGQYNVSLGHQTMLAATSGNNNVAIGENSLLRATSPGNNVAVGCGALLAALDSASGNVALGFQAGNNITTGDGNVVIGNADVSSATGDNQLSISSGADGSVVWMTGDSSGTVSANGGELTTTGKAFVMGF